MEITDELRHYIEGAEQLYGRGCPRLTAMCDRIDAEHEEAIASVMNDALYHANDKDMADLGWVRLPKDADGEYVHIVDVMAYADNTKPMEVVALVPQAVFLTEDGPRYADMCRHYHAPTVEDLLHSFICDVEEDVRDEREIIAEYAAKLRLADAGEER